LGSELNGVTIDRMTHETRMNVPQYIWRRMQYT
jgi:hypothetical protein